MEIMKMVQKKHIEQYLARGHDIRTTSERGGAARSVRHDREPNIFPSAFTMVFYGLRARGHTGHMVIINYSPR